MVECVSRLDRTLGGVRLRAQEAEAKRPTASTATATRATGRRTMLRGT